MTGALAGAAAMMGRRRASAGGGFDPLTLPGLTAALRSSLTGSPVSSWNDDTGNGRHFTQGTGALQPAVGTLNGLAAPDFDQAAVQRMTGPGPNTLIGSGDFEVWIVFDIDAIAGPGAPYYDAPAVVTDTDGWWALAVSDATNGVIFGYNDGSSGDVQCNDAGNFADGAIHVARARAEGTSLYLRVDDRSEVSAGGVNARRAFTSSMKVGASWADNRAVGGTFHVFFFDAILGAPDVAAFYAWIASTYGATVPP